MSVIIKNLRDDLPNQEKNKYWTVYIDNNMELYKLLVDIKESDQETVLIRKRDQGKQSDLSEKGRSWNDGKSKMQEWKHGSLFGMTYFTRRERQKTAACLKKLWSYKSKKYCSVKIRYLSVYYDNKKNYIRKYHSQI